MENAIEVAWGIIANAHGGDWSKASPEWRQAAERWRDEYVTGCLPVVTTDLRGGFVGTDGNVDKSGRVPLLPDRQSAKGYVGGGRHETGGFLDPTQKE